MFVFEILSFSCWLRTSYGSVFVVFHGALSLNIKVWSAIGMGEFPSYRPHCAHSAVRSVSETHTTAKRLRCSVMNWGGNILHIPQKETMP